MSYRSKKTFIAASSNENASLNKQPTSVVPDSSLDTSKLPKHSSLTTSQPSKPSSFVTPHQLKPSCPTTSKPDKQPSKPSASKWGPFNPSMPQASQTFGYIAEPIKPSMAVKNMTKFTMIPSMKPSHPSMPQFPSSLHEPHLRTSNSQKDPSQTTLDTPQQPTVHTTKASLQQQRKVTQSMSMASKQNLKFAASQQQRKSVGAQSTVEATSVPHQPQKMSSTSSQHKEAELSQQEKQQLPLKRTPLACGTKPSLEKRLAAASVGATKPKMSQTPPNLETMTLDKNQVGSDVSNDSFQPFQSKECNPYMHVTEGTQDMERLSPHIHDEIESGQHHSLVESSSDSEHLNEVGDRDTSVKKGKSAKPRPRNRIIVPNWPEHVKFDEHESALAYDSNGKSYLIKGCVQPRDIWIDNEFTYFVQFNDFKQPVGRGGSILVSFLGDVAKREAFCPVGYTSWHKLNPTMRASIVTAVRKHFVIPDGELFDKAILKCTSKYWKSYRFFLRHTYFDPKNRTKEQIVNNRPDGVNKRNWTDLVDYWYSPKFQKLSKLGKDARASLAHIHFSGATSFANRRVNLANEKGAFSELDFYKEVYTKEDGSCKEGTLSKKILEDANTKVQENLASSSKSKVEVENDVFNELMYDKEVPKRPPNYGFGVKQSDIFGVQSFFRKEKSNNVNHEAADVESLKAALLAVQKQNEDLQQKNEALESKFMKQNERNEALETKFNETNLTFKAVTAQLGQVLKIVRNGNASSQVLDRVEAAISVLNYENSQTEDELGMAVHKQALGQSYRMVVVSIQVAIMVLIMAHTQLHSSFNGRDRPYGSGHGYYYY